MTDKILNVVFVCSGNTARSIMAEVLLNRPSGGRFKAYGPGSQPKGLHPRIVELLQHSDFDLDRKNPAAA